MKAREVQEAWEAREAQEAREVWEAWEADAGSVKGEAGWQRCIANRGKRAASFTTKVRTDPPLQQESGGVGGGVSCKGEASKKRGSSRRTEVPVDTRGAQAGPGAGGRLAVVRGSEARSCCALPPRKAVKRRAAAGPIVPQQ